MPPKKPTTTQDVEALAATLLPVLCAAHPQQAGVTRLWVVKQAFDLAEVFVGERDRRRAGRSEKVPYPFSVVSSPGENPCGMGEPLGPPQPCTLSYPDPEIEAYEASQEVEVARAEGFVEGRIAGIQEAAWKCEDFSSVSRKAFAGARELSEEWTHLRSADVSDFLHGEIGSLLLNARADCLQEAKQAVLEILGTGPVFDVVCAVVAGDANASRWAAKKILLSKEPLA